MKQRIPNLDTFISLNENKYGSENISLPTYESLKEGRVKDAMYDMIENIVNSFNDAKSNNDKNKIATIIEDICGYDPRNEKTEDFETALWELEFLDLIEITENIKKAKLLKESEDFVNEAEEFTYKGTTYKVDYIKQKGWDGPTWDLLLTDKKTGTIYAWPSVFSYSEGWSQGTGRSVREWYLETRGYGGAGNGSGQSSRSTPYYIDSQLEYIITHWQGKGYSKDSQDWYQNNVSEFPKGTKKLDIKRALQ